MGLRNDARPHSLAVAFASLISLAIPLKAQWWDAPAACGNEISEQTDGKLTLSFEFRTRIEDKNGVDFGKSPDLSYGLVRTRFGLSYKPVEWLKVSAMIQDARAPEYNNAPPSVRDPADLQEAYVELFPNQKTGFGMSAGRRMISYGEGRLIGIPDWSALSRTYDHGSVYYRLRRARIEMLYLSPVKINMGEFNSPVLGDHIWGTYDVFPNLFSQNTVDAYILRRDQNRPGGFIGGKTSAGTDRLGITTYGFRATGPVTHGIRYSVEGAAQSGNVGAASQRAFAWYSRLNRNYQVAGRPLDVSGEYKFASGTRNPQDSTHTGTFDQLYASNHDKFGHEDLFGWRNVHNLRSLETLGLTKALAVNFMYNSFWLASTRDALYNGQGRAIAQSITGIAGRHVGQEVDVFATYGFRHWLFGAGYGYLFKGEFIRSTTPGVNPSYAYVFQTYSF